jgi:hypothetical protein
MRTELDVYIFIVMQYRQNITFTKYMCELFLIYWCYF